MNGLNIRLLVGMTLRNPAQAARAILDVDYPLGVRWALAVLVVSLAAILASLTAALVTVPVDGEPRPYGWIVDQPLILAGLQMAAVVLSAGLMAGVGRMFGGDGTFEDALILVVWIEAVLLLVQLAQIVLLPIMPGLGALLGLAAAGMFFYLTVQFTKVLHGFRSGFKVFLGMVAAMFAFAFLLSFVAAAFGLLPEVPA
ncbi:YIP1 family protein [Paracoccus tegillarcae]|nr:YIP1 family protein [Paracoccus tegillarcae]